MSIAVQQLLLALYRLLARSGFTSTALGRAMYRRTYFLYKRYVEAPGLRSLRGFVDPESWVIDVGANIGFTTSMFASWVTAGGGVIALEPDPANFRELEHTLRTRRTIGKVVTRQAAATRTTGTAHLAQDPDHPGNHRLAEAGLPVEAVSLEDLLEELGRPPVSLVKIDVQGAEAEVLAGAVELIEREHPVLLIEIDTKALGRFGTDAREMVSKLSSCGYIPHRLGRRSLSGPLDLEEAVSGDGYFDLVLVPTEACGGGDLIASPSG